METEYRCVECERLCELVERDDGGWEECWGARVWHAQYTDYSDCCTAEYEEVSWCDVCALYYTTDDPCELH